MKGGNFIRDMYGGISKEIWILATTMFINRCGSMVLLFLSVYLNTERHLSIQETGIVVAVYGLGSMFGAFIAGKLVDRIGYYPILIISLLLTGMSIIILGYMKSFYSILPLAFVVTTCADAFRPANAASIRFYSTQDGYTKSIALNRLAMNLGFVISPIIGGFLAHYSYQGLFWVDGITSILAATFLFKRLPKPPISSTNKNIETISEHKEITNPYRDKFFLFFVSFVTIYAIAFFQIFTALPLYFKNELHYTEGKIGAVMAVNGLGVAVMEMFLIHYIQKRWSQFKFIGLGCLLLIAGLLVYLISKSILIVLLSIILITFSEMFAMPFMSTFAMNRPNKDSMGQYSALYAMSWSLALVLAPLVCTNILHWWNFQTLWICLSCIALISFFGFRWLNTQLN